MPINLARLTKHPLPAIRKVGPIRSGEEETSECLLAQADRVLTLVESGQLLPMRDRSSKAFKRKLSDEQLRELAYRVQSFGDTEARNQIVLSNMGLVHMVLSEFKNRGVATEDLLQEGILGIIRATESFDPSRDIKFSTYAVYWVRAKLQRVLQKHHKQTHVPVGGMEQAPDGRRFRPQQRIGSIDELLADDHDEDRFSAKQMSGLVETPEDSSLRDETTRRVRQAVAVVAGEMPQPYISTLVRDRLLSAEPQTLEKIGKRFDLSREAIRQAETKIIRRLRDLQLEAP